MFIRFDVLRFYIVLAVLGLTTVQALAKTPLSLQDIPSEDAMRQCRGLYFSSSASAWFEVDCLVAAECAAAGVLVDTTIPDLGAKRLWIIEVLKQPRVMASLPRQHADALQLEQAPAFTASTSEATQGTTRNAGPPQPLSPLHGLNAPPDSPASAAPASIAPTVQAAVIILEFPPETRLKVNGTEVSTKYRHVLVPDLEPGATYEYQLQAEFDRDGQPVIDERTIAFIAGDTVSVDFTTPERQ
jgi:uncharacterized protein (TIGR03000 family)